MERRVLLAVILSFLVLYGLFVPDGGTFTNPTWSMFQSDRVALKMMMRAAWALRVPDAADAIAYMTNVAW